VQALYGLSRLSAWWVALGIDLERGRPAHPQDNAGHEGLHRDIAEELECLGQGTTAEALELWREQFNRARPHEALGMRCPAELYRDLTRRYSGAEARLSYARMASRLVDKNVMMNVTYVLNQKCYLCPDCTGERRTVNICERYRRDTLDDSECGPGGREQTVQQQPQSQA
jgi:Integrase core domain